MTGRIRTAFVMGAGLGTRLRPLTLVRPKPLIPVFGKPLITFALDHLASAGIESFVINTHHLARQFDELLAAEPYASWNIRLLHEKDLLETGGGLKNAEPWIGTGPFVVYSGDVLTDINLENLIEEHFRRENDVTLALRNTGLAAGVTLRPDGRLIDIGRGGGNSGGYDFANVSIWNSGIFRRIPAARKISFVPVLAEWLRDGGRIAGMVLDEGEWFNIGSRKEYLAVHRAISERRWKPDYLRATTWPLMIARTAAVSASARLSGFQAIGEGCSVQAGAVIEDSILWDGVTIERDAILQGCVVAGSLVISGRHKDADLVEVV